AIVGHTKPPTASEYVHSDGMIGVMLGGQNAIDVAGAPRNEPGAAVVISEKIAAKSSGGCAASVPVARSCEHAASTSVGAAAASVTSLAYFMSPAPSSAVLLSHYRP